MRLKYLVILLLVPKVRSYLGTRNPVQAQTLGHA